MPKSYLDFDGEPLKLVEDAWSTANDSQTVRNNQYQREWQLYHGWLDMAKRNPDLPNVFVPKIFNIIEIVTPRNVKHSIGIRPFIPFESYRKEFRDQSEMLSEAIDELLFRANFYNHYHDNAKIKTTFGTGFLENIPVYQEVMQKHIVVDDFGNQVFDVTGQPAIQEVPVQSLRFRVRTLAPWEVYVDPFATGLEEADQCRYVVKLQLVSPRQIVRLAERGAYPGIDPEELVEQLTKAKESGTAEVMNHWGMTMLTDMGLSMPANMDDMGVLMRYESPERYIDVYNGLVVLRDIDNPYKHKLINLSRHKHRNDPHTQNQFWGIGEVKPNEILQNMLNDLWNMSLTSHQIHNQPITYFKKDAVHPDALVRTAGNRVELDISGERSIQDTVSDAPITPLPTDHYAMPSAVERMMDITSAIYDAQRGEASPRRATASEYALRREAGDIRLELEIRNSETFLADIGVKALSHFDQFAKFSDKAEILGMDRALTLEYSNPNDLPGGFNFIFKGSDRAANSLIKQKNWKEILPLILQIPNAKLGKIAHLFMQAFEIPQREIDEALWTDEELAAIQQQQMQQQLALQDIQETKQRRHELNIAQQKKAQQGQKSGGQSTAAKGAQTQRSFAQSSTENISSQNAQENIP